MKGPKASKLWLTDFGTKTSKQNVSIPIGVCCFKKWWGKRLGGKLMTAEEGKIRESI
jgi:hypothetical protein